jgi:hypothetical protein
MHCASTAGDPFRLDVIGTDLSAAPGDYAPPTGFSANLVQLGFVPDTPDRRGVMRPNQFSCVADIRDGTSTTLMITEDAGRPAHWTSQGVGPDNVSLGCGNFSVSDGRVRGAGWADTASSIPLHGFSPDGLSCPGPCAINCTNNNEAFSFHPAGADTLFADGGVRFLQETIDIATYAALITRAGNEVISEAF